MVCKQVFVFRDQLQIHIFPFRSPFQKFWFNEICYHFISWGAFVRLPPSSIPDKAPSISCWVWHDQEFLSVKCDLIWDCHKFSFLSEIFSLEIKVIGANMATTTAYQWMLSKNCKHSFPWTWWPITPWVHPPPLLNQVNPTWLIKTPILFSHSRPYSPSTMLPTKMTYSTVVCSAPPVLLALWWPRWLRADLRINVFQAAAEISFSFSDFAVDCGRNCGLCPK